MIIAASDVVVPIGRPALGVPVGMTGLGSALGELVVPNSAFEAKLDTSDEWIRTRTGIRSRHHASEAQSTATLATEAALAAMDDANVTADMIDLIVVATATPDEIVPSAAARVQAAIGAHGAAAFDVSAACSGFLYAVHVAQAFVRSGIHQRILVIGAETLSRRMNKDDRASAVLFGDGAGAAVLEQGGGLELVRSTIGTDGREAELIQVPNPCPTGAGKRWISVDGHSVFKFAVRRMVCEVRTALDELGITAEQVSRVIPHQANSRIIHAAAESLGLRPDQVFTCIEDIANTSAASVPIAMQRSMKLRPFEHGEIVVTVGFGGGVTWGCQVWQANGCD